MAKTAQIELGGAVELGATGTNGTALVIAIGIVVILCVMLVYLIALRAMRLSAESWLKENRHILFSHAANLKPEEEILEKLVNGQSKPNHNHTTSRSIAAISPKVATKEVTENLLDMDH